MIRILFMIDILGTSPGGTEGQLLKLIEGLDRRRFEPSLFILRRGEGGDDSYRCITHNIGITSWRDPRTARKIASFLKTARQGRFDLLQTQFFESNTAGVILGRLAGIPHIIATRRSQGYWVAPGELFIQRRINSLVYLFIVNSISTKRWAMEAEKIPADRIRVIYNSVDVDAFRASPETREEYRARLGIRPGTPVVGIVSNLRRVKAIDVFLRSAAVVLRSRPEVRFLIVGEDDQREEGERLRRLTREMGIEGSVSFLGQRGDIPALLSIFSIGVLSSSSESLSNSIVEYMAAGLPVVCTDVGGARELVDEGVHGFVVHPGDHEGMAAGILSILGSPDAFPAARNIAKVRSICDPGLVLGSYESLYEEIAGRGRPPGVRSRTWIPWRA